MSNAYLDSIWSIYTISPESGMSTLRDTCVVLLNHPLSSSHLVPAIAGVALHPSLAEILREVLPILKHLLYSAAEHHGYHQPLFDRDHSDFRIATTIGVSVDEVEGAWRRLRQKLAGAMRCIEYLCSGAPLPASAPSRASAPKASTSSPSSKALRVPQEDRSAVDGLSVRGTGVAEAKGTHEISSITTPSSLYAFLPSPSAASSIESTPNLALDSRAASRAVRSTTLVAPSASSRHSCTYPAGQSTLRREFPSRQAGHTVEEFHDKSTTSRMDISAGHGDGGSAGTRSPVIHAPVMRDAHRDYRTCKKYPSLDEVNAKKREVEEKHLLLDLGPVSSSIVDELMHRAVLEPGWHAALKTEVQRGSAPIESLSAPLATTAVREVASRDEDVLVADHDAGEKEPIPNEMSVSKGSEQKERIRVDRLPPDESCPPSVKTESVLTAGAALSDAGALRKTTTCVDSAKSEIEVLEAASIQLLNNRRIDWPLTAEHARDSMTSITSGTTSAKALEREPLLPSSSTDVEGVSTTHPAMEVEGLKESRDDSSKKSCEDDSLKSFPGNGESPIRISGPESAIHPAIRTEDSGGAGIAVDFSITSGPDRGEREVDSGDDVDDPKAEACQPQEFDSTICRDEAIHDAVASHQSSLGHAKCAEQPRESNDTRTAATVHFEPAARNLARTRSPPAFGVERLGAPTICEEPVSMPEIEDKWRNAPYDSPPRPARELTATGPEIFAGRGRAHLRDIDVSTWQYP
ncbi:hypothetical protein B0H11DRAFT_2333973 [Mycena galericulata]|nr:hypothetical protein B0H11DRAFT_2333973 [Mycena galericulata]